MKRIAPDITDPEFDPKTLEDQITCASCGCRMKAGHGYQQRYRSRDGHYYLICRSCHRIEWSDADGKKS